MSAFVVEDALINSVVTFLARTDSRRTIYEETGCDIGTTEGQALLGEKMFSLNVEAVEQRYGKGEAASFRTLDYQFRPSPPLRAPASIVQTYKSLQCWRYQCSEGDVPETSLLYATMNRVLDQLAHAIVQALPAYDRAEW